MAKQRQTHVVHKYMRVRWGKNGTVVYRCMLPDCPHYAHPEMTRNRRSICWKCGSIFIMTGEKLQVKKPKCDKCQHKADPVLSRLDGLLDDIAEK